MAISCNSRRGMTGIRRLTTSRLLCIWQSPAPSTTLDPLHFLLSLGTRFYAAALKHDQQQACSRKRSLPAFVISVGNMVAGGTGKTPFTLLLAGYLKQRGWTPAILSRGYGGAARNIVQAPSKGETRQQVLRFGDEPVLMARRMTNVPVWVGRDRWMAGKNAVELSGSDILLLDDGFQHLALERDLDFVLLDAHKPFGNGCMLPLGSLREPVKHLERADAIVLTRAEDPEKVRATRSTIGDLFPGKPVFACRHRLSGFRAGLSGPVLSSDAFRDQPAIAFAGIACPETFFDSLADLGIRIRRSFSFPDHHAYRRADLVELLESLRQTKVRFLITTEKDAVRLPPEIQAVALVAELEVDFGSEKDELLSYLERRLLWKKE